MKLTAEEKAHFKEVLLKMIEEVDNPLCDQIGIVACIVDDTGASMYRLFATDNSAQMFDKLTREMLRANLKAHLAAGKPEIH